MTDGYWSGDYWSEDYWSGDYWGGTAAVETGGGTGYILPGVIWRQIRPQAGDDDDEVLLMIAAAIARWRG